QCRRGPADPGEDNLRIERDQLGRISRQVREGADAPAIIDPQVASNRPARFRKPLQERQQARLRFRIVRTAVHEHADAPHALALLSACSERPRRRAAEKRDEVAALHSITSSARASSVGGTSRPSALAVLRLITSSYLVGACTGRSTTLPPRKMRSTYVAAR